jgi:bifunctional UDP-N-acetylglucosamine pyrophosphorylase/glucosamine-1-phosphate N-acetyltransferase
MNEVNNLLKQLKAKMKKENEFAFWHFLDKLEKINFNEKNKIIKGKIEDNVSINGFIFLGKNSIIKQGTLIEGNAFIGNNCVVGPNAFLRKNVILEGNNVIANSEIKNSIILKNSKVPHFSYVGDSIIGSNCNLGAGTKLANLRFDDKTVKVSIKGKKIDSKRRKLGSLLHDNVKTGINSSINCGLILAKNSIVYPGRILSRNLKKNEEFI